MRMGKLTPSLAAALFVVTSVGPALADPTDQERAAQVLFDDGVALMAQGKYAEACPKLDQSQKTDPTIVTAYRLAECNEKLGKLATAWAQFIDVATLARKAGTTDREETARKRAEALRPRVPRLTVTVSDEVAAQKGLVVTRDGAPIDAGVWGRELPIDPGEHRIAAAAPGKQPWEARVEVAEGAVVPVVVPVLADEPGKSGGPAGPGAARTDGPSGKGQRIAAVAAGVVGLTGVAVGTIFGLMASSTWDDAQAGCVGGAPDRCTPDAQSLGDDASTQATVSTIGFVVGGVGLAGAAVLWLTAPSAPSRAPSGATVRVAPWAAATGAGISAGGRF